MIKLPGLLKLVIGSAVLCGWAVLSSCGAAEPGGRLEILKREEGGAWHLYARNLQLAPVTATFRLQSVNVQAGTNFPCTITLAGNQTLELCTLAPLKPESPWNYHLNYASVIGSASAAHDDSCVYRLPYAAGSSFCVSQGYQGSFSHSGPDKYAIDWRMPIGTPVHAAREGTVVESVDVWNRGGPDRKLENSANRILVLHADGTIAIYGHLQQGGNVVKVGDRVQAGDLLGLSGDSGFTNGPHLHFAVFKAGDGSHRVSLPVKFRVGGVIVPSLTTGKWYPAPALESRVASIAPVAR